MSAVMEVEEKLKDITDCPICLETYKEPKILPCIHTFCMHCLRETGEKLNKKSGDTMPCPVCRKEFLVPDTGFTGLQKNFFMDKLTEIKNILQPTSARNLCDACREDNEAVEACIPSAEMYCVQCHQRLCSECHKHHRKNKVTKSHKFIVSGQHNFDSEGFQEALMADSCGKHQNNPLEIYCSDCQEVVCAICFVEKHKYHDGSDINKVATGFRKEIEMNVDYFSLLMPELKKEESVLEDYQTEIMKSLEEIESNVNKRRQELKELVDKDADSLLLELDSIRQQNLKKRELNKENIDTLLVCLESYKVYCLKLTAVGSASDICRAKNALDVRTKELKQFHTSAGKSSYQLPRVRLKITDLQDRLRSASQNIVGILEDDSGAEDTFQYTINNISKLRKSSLSPPCYLHDLPWKIFAMLRTGMKTSKKHSQKNFGFFLQCNGESDSETWSCNGAADLRILNQKPDGKPLCRKIQHLFCSKENDWGFSNFITLSELLDPEKGYVKDDAVTLEVYVKADAPHGVE